MSTSVGWFVKLLITNNICLVSNIHHRWWLSIYQKKIVKFDHLKMRASKKEKEREGEGEERKREREREILTWKNRKEEEEKYMYIRSWSHFSPPPHCTVFRCRIILRVDITLYWPTCLSICLFTISGHGPACWTIPPSLRRRNDRCFVSSSPVIPLHSSTLLSFACILTRGD